ncbi:MAG: hypothetical protein IJR88_05275 [Clostridia bacterium]|nr:hypothetical protein [Clostridia bacterium]
MAQHYDNLPNEFQPLSPWTYFWLNVLYNIPIIGLIVLIIHAIGSPNVNKKNYARSHFCILVLIAIVALVIFLATGGIAGLQKVFEAIKS